MKPTKNSVFCKDCERTKMLFETEKKAENFIKFNNEEIEAESGFSPQRSYYCLFCAGWHVTSIKDKIGLSKKEQRFEQYKQEKEKKKATELINQCKTTSNTGYKVNNQEEQNNKIKNLEKQVEEMEHTQKEKYLSEKITILNEEIELLLNSNSSTDKEKLKELRQYRDILYVVRKQNGFIKPNKKLEEMREKEINEWRLWAENKGY